MKKKWPLVTIVIPCRNEKDFIGRCLDSIIKSNYPKINLEVLVADGCSDDKTQHVVKEYSRKYKFIKLIINKKNITSVGLNLGIKRSKGKYIIILGAHSTINDNFIANNIQFILKYNVECVGGRIITLPPDNSLKAHSISYVLSHPLGVGNSYFRIGSKKMIYTDTVPFGCYNKNIFSKIGYFDEELVRNQDDEFNLRIIKNKGKILLIPDILSYYYSRSNWRQVGKQYFQYGFYKVNVIKKLKKILTIRQIVPVSFILVLFLLLILSFINKFFLYTLFILLSIYIIVTFISSLLISIKKSIKLVPYIIISFIVIHFTYGLGFLKGIFNFMILNRKYNDIKLSR